MGIINWSSQLPSGGEREISANGPVCRMSLRYTLVRPPCCMHCASRRLVMSSTGSAGSPLTVFIRLPDDGLDTSITTCGRERGAASPLRTNETRQSPSES